jgi:XTP/dITP diphosphohydrolase
VTGAGPGSGRRRRLLLATGNAHKVAEVQSILGEPWLVVARDPAVEETGSTFEENALLKARAVAASAGDVAIADDSGIEIDALGGAPGVQSARWADKGDWIPRVLRELAGVPEAGRGCRYVCAAAAVWPDPHAREFVVRGVVEGRVAEAPRGTGGFGYDPIMVPTEGDGRTFAEMTDQEKHALSHRARAFRTLAQGVRVIQEAEGR